MARKATGKSGTKKSSGGATKSRKTGTSVARRAASSGGNSGSQESMGDAFIKLLQSPLVAELVAVAATAALAALAEHGFTSRDETTRSRRAGKAAASAIGRRLANEFEEIRAAAKDPRAGAKA